MEGIMATAATMLLAEEYKLPKKLTMIGIMVSAAMVMMILLSTLLGEEDKLQKKVLMEGITESAATASAVTASAATASAATASAATASAATAVMTLLITLLVEEDKLQEKVLMKAIMGTATTAVMNLLITLLAEKYKLEKKVPMEEIKKGIKGFFSGTIKKVKKLAACHEFAEQIRELKSRIVEASQRRDRYKLDAVLDSGSTDVVPVDPRLPALYAEASSLVGTDAPRDELIKLVDDGEKSLKVVSIVGIGGLGKTTLANQVYQKVGEQFDCRAFVSVSQKPDFLNILRSILFQIEKQEHERTESGNEECLINALRDFLKDKRYFIVIDDIWSAEAWEIIKCALLENTCGSRILVTTRIATVAKSCCSPRHDLVYELRPLSKGDSKSLFLLGCGAQIGLWGANTGTIRSGEVINPLALELLEKVTGGFSEENNIGSGGYGKVYKGILNGKEIAVKRLHDHLALDDVIFKNEFENLKRVQHQNIVELVGYCNETRHINVEHNGRIVRAEMVDRVLCFEYLQNGSLDKHLYEEHRGLDWCTRYKIIKGICEGLNYLHGLEESILHLDLKPANILLDENMVPKIADFGLSRLFGETHTHITKNLAGTGMYMPPEYITEGKITKKYDVFSLGVIIIQIMTGRKGYSEYCETSPQQFIELVHQKWKVRVEATSMHTSAGEDFKQVKRCIKIALNCVKPKRQKRPTIGDIIHKLRETESVTHEVPMSLQRPVFGCK